MDNINQIHTNLKQCARKYVNPAPVITVQPNYRNNGNSYFMLKRNQLSTSKMELVDMHVSMSNYRKIKEMYLNMRDLPFKLVE